MAVVLVWVGSVMVILASVMASALHSMPFTLVCSAWHQTINITSNHSSRFPSLHSLLQLQTHSLNSCGHGSAWTHLGLLLTDLDKNLIHEQLSFALGLAWCWANSVHDRTGCYPLPPHILLILISCVLINNKRWRAFNIALHLYSSPSKISARKNSHGPTAWGMMVVWILLLCCVFWS